MLRPWLPAWKRCGNDRGHLTADEVGRQHREPIKATFRRAVFDCDVLAFDEAARFKPWRNAVTRCSASASDVLRRNPIHRQCRLLRARRKRPRRRAAKRDNEFSPPDVKLPCGLSRRRSCRCNGDDDITPLIVRSAATSRSQTASSASLNLQSSA